MSFNTNYKEKSQVYMRISGRVQGPIRHSPQSANFPVMSTEKPETLKEKVIKRAEMIRMPWQDIPAAPRPAR